MQTCPECKETYVHQPLKGELQGAWKKIDRKKPFIFRKVWPEKETEWTVMLWCPECDWLTEHEIFEHMAECKDCREPHELTEEEKAKIESAPE